jgi:hypothetical protein
MLTREETLRRLGNIEKEIVELRRAISDEALPDGVSDRTKAFLEKCGGWEDSRTPDEIIADIRASRVNATRVPCFSDEDER